GISMSGLAAPSEVPATETPIAETIYVEQPIVEVAPIAPAVSPLPPRIIAILPPDAATDASVTDTGTAYTTPAPGSVSGDPVLPPSYSDDEDDDGDYAGGDDEDGDDGDGDGGGDDD
ncbi:MAG: hypothetical protein NTV67_06270, partial [Chloroflexi bacterium]|nr:hypothetical protein [Chloroflexota bacterium]